MRSIIGGVILGSVFTAMPDSRDPERVRHAMFEMVMARAAAISAGSRIVL
jgi:hypothetical protein